MGKIKVKNEKMFKNKAQMIIYLLAFIVILALFIYLGNKDYNQNVDDNVRLANELKIDDKDNVFKYANHSDAYNVISGNTGIVLFGHQQNKWLPYYANIVNDVAKEVGINTIYYYDFYEDREANNGTYEAIVNKLASYVTYDDLSKGNIYSPTLVVVVGDEIIYYDDQTAVIKGNISPDSYWSDLNVGLKKSELTVVFNEYIESSGK